MIRHLPPREPTEPAGDGPGPDHPMRKVTRQVAFEPGGWTPERAKKVEAHFDNLSKEWASRHSEHRLLPLEDALERGEVSAETCIELGAGTGPGTEFLCRKFDRVYALDLSQEMLRLLDPTWGHRVRADASRSPLRDESADVLVLMNMLLFPDEVARVRPQPTSSTLERMLSPSPASPSSATSSIVVLTGPVRPTYTAVSVPPRPISTSAPRPP